MKRSLFVIPVRGVWVVRIVTGGSETHRHAEQTKRSKGNKNRPLFDHPIIINPSPIQLIKTLIQFNHVWSWQGW